MDLPLWDLLNGQGYLMLSYKSNYSVGHGWGCNYSCQGLDIIEEDALNEKSCVQVLRILIHKADEDIIKLEEDILMLECQLAWDNEEWSQPCSVALKKRIDHLDVLIQSSKIDVKYVRRFGAELEESGKLSEKLHDLVKPLLENYFLVKNKKNEVKYVRGFSAELEEPGRLSEKLHDLMKPLLENYFLVKSKKTGSSNMVVPSLPSGGLGNKKMEANTSKLNKNVETKQQVNQRRKGVSMEPKERKNNLPKRPSAEKAAMTKNSEDKALSYIKSEGYWRKAESASTPLFMPVEESETATHKNEDIISKFFKNAQQYAEDKFAAKDINKLNRQMGKKIPKSAPLKSGKRSIINFEEPSISMVKQDTRPSRTKKAGSRGRGMMGNNEVVSNAEVHQRQFVHEIKVTNSYLESQEKNGKAVQPAYVIYGGQLNKEITETRETRAYRHAINKDLFCKKRKKTNFPERTETLETEETESIDSDSVSLFELFKLKRKNPSMGREKMEDKHQGKQITKDFFIKLDSPNYHVKPDQGLEKTRERAQEIAPGTFIPEETRQGLSWTEKVIHNSVFS